MVSEERPQQYEIVVRGRLSERYGTAFDGLTLQPNAGTTTLSGAIVDQSQLYGLLNRLQALGIELISVRADTSEPASERGQRAR
jgi:hypothetical protein